MLREMIDIKSLTSDKFFNSLVKITKKNDWILCIYVSDKKYGIVKLTNLYMVVYFENAKSKILGSFSTFEIAATTAELLID